MIRVAILAFAATQCGGTSDPAPRVVVETETETEAEAETEAETETETETDSDSDSDSEAEADAEADDWFVAQCSAGNADACMEAAQRNPQQRDTHIQHALALRQATCDLCGRDEDGCDPVQCVAIAELYADGVYVERDEALARQGFEAALPWLRQRCRSGPDYERGRNCRALAALALHGVGGSRQSFDRLARRAIGPFTRACRDGDVLACAAWGSAYWNGEGVERNEARATEIWNDAKATAETQCDEGVTRACDYLAFRRAMQTPPSP